MANGDGRGGRQRQTYKQYIERYINGTYSEDEQCVGGTQTGGGIMLWTSDTSSVISTARTRVVCERHADGRNHSDERFVERSSTARKPTSGARAAQVRAERPAAVH